MAKRSKPKRCPIFRFHLQLVILDAETCKGIAPGKQPYALHYRDRLPTKEGPQPDEKVACEGLAARSCASSADPLKFFGQGADNHRGTMALVWIILIVALGFVAGIRMLAEGVKEQEKEVRLLEVSAILHGGNDKPK